MSQRPGEMWRPPTIAQEDGWDLAAADIKRRTTANPSKSSLQVRDPDIIKIRNDSGATRTRFQVLALNGPVITPSTSVSEFYRQPVFKGIQPQAVTSGTTHVGKFAMLLDVVPDEKFCLAVVGGIWPCLVDRKHADHPYCDIAHESYDLTSNWYGKGEILWHDGTSAGTPGKALVQFSNFTSIVLDGQIDESSGIAADATGTVEVFWEGAITDPLATLEAAYKWITPSSSLANNTKVRVSYKRELHEWRIIDHDC